MKKTAKKKKLKTVRWLKKKLDTVFSIYIRSTAADQYGQAECYTCGLVAPWKQLQCGHYLRRSRLFTRWEPKNCRVQCYRCNIILKGNYEEFADRLMQEDPSEWEWLMGTKCELRKYTRDEMESMIQRYTVSRMEVGR